MLDNCTTIPGLVTALAQSSPDRTALHYQKGSDSRWYRISWAEYAHTVEKYAAGLQAAGISAGESVIVMMATQPDWEYVEKAVLLNRAVVVGVETHVPTETAQQIAEAVKAEFLICDSIPILERFNQATRESFRTVFVRDAYDQNSTQNLHSDIRRLSTLNETPCVNFVAPTVSPNDRAIVIFTSGTTGTPKGLAYTHEQVLIASAAILERFDWLNETHKTICWLPLANLFQRMINLTAMSCGAAIYMVRDPRDLVSVLNDIKPTVLIGVPKLYQTIYQRFIERISKLPLPLEKALVTSTGTINSLVRKLLLYRFRQIFGGQIKCLISGSAPCSSTLLDFL